jgi:hypothetical protein
MVTKRERRPAKKTAKKTAKKPASNSKIAESQKAATDSLKAQSDAEKARLARLAALAKDPKNPTLEPKTNTPMASAGKGIDQGSIAARDSQAGKNMSDAAQKIVGLAQPLVAQAQTEKRAISNPALYGKPAKDRAANLTARITAQQQAMSAANKAKGNAVYMGVETKKVKLPTIGPGRYDDSGSRTEDATTSAEMITSKDELLSWLTDEAKVAQIKAAANKAGIDVQTYDDIAKLWSSVVSTAASSYSLTGKKVTPWSILTLRGKYMGLDGKPADKVTTSTSIDEMDPAQARLMFEQTATQALGRSATKQEIDDFIAKAQTIAKQNPGVTTTTSKMGFDGNITDQTSRTTGGADVVSAKAQLAAQDQAKQSEDYAAYQAAGNYFPMLFDALSSPV